MSFPREQGSNVGPLEFSKILASYQASQHRLLLLDYDGTLMPIFNDPAAAIPSSRVIDVLGRLASDPRNTTWIISGRKQSFLDQHLGQLSQIGLCAEHGAFSRAPGCSEWENSAANQNLSWRDEVLDVFGKYTEKTPGSVIEQKQIAVVWHFRNADPKIGLSAAEACKADLKELFAKNGWDLELTHGKMILEVCPRSVNKGAIALRLVDESQTGDVETDFVLCLGDDLTDEDMFRALQKSRFSAETIFSVFVGSSSRPTVADWSLRGPTQVVALLELLSNKSAVNA